MKPVPVLLAMLLLPSIIAPGAAWGQTAGRWKLPRDTLIAYSAGDYDGALLPLHAEIARCEATRPPDGACLDLLLSAANIHWRRNDLPAGLIAAQKAYALAMKVLPPTHDDVDVATGFVARVLEAQGQWAAADPYQRQIMAIREATLPRTSLRLAAIYSILAYNLNERAQYAEAEHYIIKEIVVREAVKSDRLDDWKKLATAYNILAYSIDQQGREAQAEQYLRVGLKIREALLPSGDPEIPRLIAESWYNIGWNLQAQGRFADAETAVRRSLDMRITALPAGHPDIVEGYTGLAAILDSQNKLADAETLYRRIVEMREGMARGSPANLAFAYGNLGYNLNRQRKLEEAETFLRKAIVLAEKALPADHPDLAILYANIADNISSQSRWDDAEPYHRKGLALRERTLQPMHRLIGASLNRLAWNLVYQQRMAEAETLFRRSRRIGAAIPAIANPERIGGNLSLAKFLTMQGQAPREARALFAEAGKGVLDRVKSYPGFDADAFAELRSYRPVFVGQVKTAWTLSRP